MTEDGKERLRSSKLGALNPAKRPDVREKISAALQGTVSGPNNPHFKGEWPVTKDGRTRMFVWIDEPMRARLGLKRSYAPRARVVWVQAHPDEPLSASEPIHHINGDPMDDRPENLRKMADKRAHQTLHVRQNEPAVEARREASPVRCGNCGAAIRSWRKFCSIPCRAAARQGEAHPNTGRTWSPEVRERMGAQNKGRKASPETREKMRVAHLADWAKRKAINT